MKPWKDLTVDQQHAFQHVVRRLDMDIRPMTAPGAPIHIDFAQRTTFMDHQVFLKGVLWFDAQQAMIEDMAHDLGHALCLSPEDRMAFARDDGDIETEEAPTMLVQWAIMKNAMPDYELAQSLDDFGYGFGFEPKTGRRYDGIDWEKNLSQGRVWRSEVGIYFHLLEKGMVSARPTLMPETKFPHLSDEADMLPGWAETTYKDAIHELLLCAKERTPPTPTAAPRRARPR